MAQVPIIETINAISANQWTGFYMIGISIMKEFMHIFRYSIKLKLNIFTNFRFLRNFHAHEVYHVFRETKDSGKIFFKDVCAVVLYLDTTILNIVEISLIGST